jgi:hypothetical protein
LAHHFGVSYEAALFQLLNLNQFTRDRFEVLRAQLGIAKSLRRALQLPGLDDGPHWNLAEQVVSLALEAHRRKLISKGKVLELARAVNVEPSEIEEALHEEGSEEEPVGPTFPE